MTTLRVMVHVYTSTSSVLYIPEFIVEESDALSKNLFESTATSRNEMLNVKSSLTLTLILTRTELLVEDRRYTEKTLCS